MILARPRHTTQGGLVVKSIVIVILGLAVLVGACEACRCDPRHRAEKEPRIVFRANFAPFKKERRRPAQDDRDRAQPQSERARQRK
jgi:hypothetical protein